MTSRLMLEPFGSGLIVCESACQYTGRALTNKPAVSVASKDQGLDSLSACDPELEAIYARCAEAYSNFDLSPADFREGVRRAVNKYLIGADRKSGAPSVSEIRRFLGQLQDLDLYLALACARGNESAWWEFDRQHRSFIERLVHHLARGTDGNEVIDSVYAALFGMTAVGGVRQSKFKSYSGRGTLRGWLRTIILHAVVDLYRGRRVEIPLEEWSNSGEDAGERSAWGTMARTGRGTEEFMLASVVRERYRSAALAALDQSLAALDDHETLLLLYYHVEGLKLREIARIVEQPRSPIRRWFQRQSKRRTTASQSRVHESTVMRWLEKVYQKVADRFQAELSGKHGLNAAEIEICRAIATEDQAPGVRLDRHATGDESLPNRKEEVGNRQVEGAP